MPIVYTKLFELLKAKGYTTYRIRQEKLIGQGTLTAIKNGTGGLDAKTIARLCEVLECQPGDLMEYVKEITPQSKTNPYQFVCPFCGSGLGIHQTGAFLHIPNVHPH